jgi:1,4-alpha-glucan branching enzyme
MGQEIGQYEEWNSAGGVRWELTEFPIHRGLQTLVRELNRLYRESPALHQVDFHYSGFEWVDFHDVEHSIVSFIRRAENPSDYLLFVCNSTPVPRHGYRIGVPEPGFFQEVLNTDAEMFGGSNMGNGGMVSTEDKPMHGQPQSVSITLPPLAVVAFRPRR